MFDVRNFERCKVAAQRLAGWEPDQRCQNTILLQHQKRFFGYQRRLTKKGAPVCMFAGRICFCWELKINGFSTFEALVVVPQTYEGMGSQKTLIMKIV